jgi:hypothetical protein
MDRRRICDHGVRGRRVARASRFVLVYLFNLWIRLFGGVRGADREPFQAAGEATHHRLVAQRLAPTWPGSADQEHERVVCPRQGGRSFST